MENPNQQQYVSNGQVTSANAVSQAPMNPPKRSGMAVASLVLGIVAVVLSWMPIINNFSFLLAVIGIVFAIVGLVGISKGKTSGKGMAIAGLVLGIASVVVVLMSQSMYSAAIDEAMSNLNTPTTSASSTSADSAASDSGTSKTDEAVGGASDSAGTADSQAAPRYDVTIDGCKQVTDYEGKPAIMVTFTWTNNSDEARSFLTAISDKAFQNGVQLETAIVMDGNDSAGASMNDVKPGATTTVTQCYLLADNGPVTVECTEWLSWDDEIIAEREFTLN